MKQADLTTHINELLRLGMTKTIPNHGIAFSVAKAAQIELGMDTEIVKGKSRFRVVRTWKNRTPGGDR